MGGRRRPSPATLAVIQQRCNVLGNRLDGAADDIIVLWRLARMLKAVDRDLRCHVGRLRWVRNADVRVPAMLLDDAEARLRLVLLDEGTLTPRQIQWHVARILGTVLEALEMLRGICGACSD